MRSTINTLKNEQITKPEGHGNEQCKHKTITNKVSHEHACNVEKPERQRDEGVPVHKLMEALMVGYF